MKSFFKRFRASHAEGFKFVYVNQDGSVRELSPNEQVYLSQEFHPADGARPFVKSSYRSLDGWGSMSGFLPRKKVPSDVRIDPVNGLYDSLVVEDPMSDFLEDCRAAGDITRIDADGSIQSTPNPEISAQERFERIRRSTLERQEKRERLGKPSETDATRAAEHTIPETKPAPENKGPSQVNPKG
ncbi:MAG: hypothetical protein QUS33_03295 [Dehalococcoidia bacterium]|nr:hypothetical protein [Dehalococcoidia bacterium]